MYVTKRQNCKIEATEGSNYGQTLRFRDTGTLLFLKSRRQGI
jgi:hypothetical protein